MQSDWRKGTTPTPRPPRGRPHRLAPDEDPRPSAVRRLQRALMAAIGLSLLGFAVLSSWGG